MGSIVRISPLGKPVKPFAARFEKVLKAELAAEQKAVLREFKITVSTWKRQPQFEVKEQGGSTTIGTNDPIYGYVNDGTKPHVIRPKKAKRLAFYAGGFVSKTVPNRLQARAGRVASTNPVFAQGVNHPGTQGRDFTGQIQERSLARLVRNLQRRLKQDLGV
jgi:hypothetical protein